MITIFRAPSFGAIFFLLVAPTIASCQTSVLKSSPDGRNFRVDSQGNQIADYVSELETEVDTLKNRVNALENDNEAKESTIVRLKKGECSQSSMTEFDIGPEASNPDADSISSLGDVRIRQLEHKIKTLKTALGSRDREIEDLRSRLGSAAPPKNKEAEEEDSEDESEERSRANFQLVEDISHERAMATRKSSELESQIATRDKLFGQYKSKLAKSKENESKKSVVIVQPGKLISASGHSLAAIKEQITQAETKREISLSLKEIDELRKIVESDISTVRRLLK